VNKVKAKAVEIAAGCGISKSTVERAFARREGKAPKPAPVKVTIAPGIDAARRHYLSYVAELDSAARRAEITAIADAIHNREDKDAA
jgi:hypothetical protein